MTENNETVFIVDDDPAVLRALTRLFRAAGCTTVRGYGSAGEFMAGHKADAPGCLVLDVSMPGFTGLELQDWLRQSKSPLPIVFLTGGPCLLCPRTTHAKANTGRLSPCPCYIVPPLAFGPISRCHDPAHTQAMLNNQPLIAVVDDDAPVRTSLRRLLRSSGYAVATFESGDAFLDSLPTPGSEGVPNCLVLDLHMPGRNGFDVRMALVTADRDIPTIVITGKDEPGTAELVHASGAVAFLTKPFDESDLLAVVRRSLASHESS